MTVGVASLARAGRAIVAMADRRLTYGDNDLVTEMMATKMLNVGNGWWSLFAGDPTISQVVVGGVDTSGGATIIGRLRAKYAEVRETMIEREILARRLLNKDLYIARPATLHPLDDRFRSEIDKEVYEYRLDCELLTMGFVPDEDDPPLGQLVTVTEGRLEHAFEGYACIGSGASAALSALVFSEIDPNDDIDVQLYQLLYAKAHSEMTPFVGFEGDAWILLADKEPIEVPGEIMKLLDRVLEDQTSLPFKHRKEWERKPNWEKSEKAPAKWEATLKDYVDSVAGKWREAT